MWFYIFLFLFCILMLIINDRINYIEKKYIEIPTILILIIVSGTRYQLGGTDYLVYKTVFDSLPTLKEFFLYYDTIHSRYITYGYETGYLFINSFVKSVGLNFYGFTLFHSIFFYAALYLGLKKYSYNFNFLIIVFLYKLFFYNTFISMRQSITLAIFFLSIQYIEEKKTFQYFFAMLIASLFHSAAFVLVPVYFINRFRITKEKIIILNVLFIPTLIISFTNLNILRYFNFTTKILYNPKVVTKAESLFNGIDSSISVFHILEYFLIMLVLIYYYDHILYEKKHSEFIIKLFLVLLPLFTLFRNYEMLTRIKDYFTFSYSLILYYISTINHGNKKTLIFTVTILISAFGFYRFILLFDFGAMIPYESYLFKDISIFQK